MTVPPKPQNPACHAAVGDWPGYFDAVGDAGPRETCLRAADLFAAGGAGDAADAPLAIDLGCGTGRDTIALLERGWRVLALDGVPEGIALMMKRPEIAAYRDGPRLATGVARFEEVALPPCRLFNSSFTLPFCPPAQFDDLWGRIVAAIESGGRFAGQFFGEQDEWASLPDRTHHTRGQVDGCLRDFEIEWMQEELYGPKPDAAYPKRWHIFHVVARRRA